MTWEQWGYDMNKVKKKGILERIVDGWSNIITGLGGDKAKNPNVSFQRSQLGQDELSNIYIADGFGRKIIDKIGKDMTREWIKINGDPAGEIVSKLNRIYAKKKFSTLVKWAKLYGGAIILMGINDGGKFEDPLNENTIKSVDFLHVIDKNYIFFQNQNFYSDPRDPSYGNPEFYSITASFTPQLASQILKATKLPIKEYERNVLTEFQVHQSRILRMDGVELPLVDKINNKGWGDSIFTAAYKQLSNLGQCYEYSAEYMHRMIQDILKFKNLSSILQRGKEGEDIVKNRLGALQKCRSWFNAVILDNEESYEETTTQLAGLTDLLDRFILALCAVLDIPEYILMGESPSGLNSRGDTDLTSWYNTIKSEQIDNLYNPLHRLISLIMKSREMSPSIKKLVNTEWDIVFNPLQQPNRVEESNIRKTTADTDQIYIQTGVLQPEEVKDSRFGGGAYSIETEIENPETEGKEDGSSNAEEANPNTAGD